MIPRIMRKWRDRRDEDFTMGEALSLGYENLLFPINLLLGMGSLITYTQYGL